MLGLPWRSVAAWTVTLSMAYALRDFMGVRALGLTCTRTGCRIHTGNRTNLSLPVPSDALQLAGTTFILSYLGNSLVDAGAARMPPQVGVMKTRRLLAVCMYALIILAVVGFGLLTIPSIMREGADLVSRIQAENPYVLLGEKLRLALGDALASKLERSLTLLTVGSTPSPAGPAAQVEVLARLAAEPVDVVTGWGAARAANFGHLLQSALKQHTSTAVNAISTSLTATSKFTLQGLVSVVLSFIIVWDRGTITAGAASLRASRLGWIYAEVAPALGAFGSLFGKALQAQLLVAIVNTALTALGMLFLELPGVAFLSVIVFFCSFVPVAGVIVSTMPIGFVALTEYGVGRLVGVIVMVLAAHAVEAYLLNPLIYSAHLKLHPLLVIIVLVLAEHSLGVWGLLLAVPFTVFVVEYVIKTPQQRVVKLPS